MLFKREILEGIAGGRITLAFRRWKRPTVKPGGSLRTAAGVVRIGRIERCELSRLTDQDAAASGLATLSALKKMLGPESSDPVYRIELTGIEPDARAELRSLAEPTPAEWKTIETRLTTWDRDAPGYFPALLDIIAGKPGVAAADLATTLETEKTKFKRDVRKLKELGLTESLDVGYRLSQRGETVRRRLRGTKAA